jgi:twitching motility protein PilU
MDLSLNLNAIVSQRLVTLKNGKRKPAAEILINTPRMADMIKNGELASLKGAMEKSLDAGMCTFDQSLYTLFRNDEVGLNEALHNADSRDGLELRIKLTDSGNQQLQGITN